MAHGNHWEALYPKIDVVLQELLPSAIQEGEIQEQLNVTSVWPDHPSERAAKVVSLVYAKAQLGIKAILVKLNEKENFKLFTAYPYAASGYSAALTIVKVRPWEYNLEAVIEARTEAGASIAFFDTEYYKNASLYKTGEKLNFRLAGLAYAVRCMNGEFIEVNGPNAQLLRQQAAGSSSDADEIEPVKVYLDELAALISSSEEYPEDMSYHCKVEALESFLLKDIRIYKVDTTFLHSEPALKGVLYISEHILPKGYQLKPGDSITGSLWMQGALVTKK